MRVGTVIFYYRCYDRFQMSLSTYLKGSFGSVVTKETPYGFRITKIKSNETYKV